MRILGLPLPSFFVLMVAHLAHAAWARQHAPWILDVRSVVPGLIAVLIPMLRRSTRIEMSSAALRTFFPDRAADSPSMRTGML